MLTGNSTPLVGNPDGIPSLTSSRYAFFIRFLSIYALVLIVVGTVGNLLTIIVLLKRHLRRFVTVRYLIIVSVCDIISLYGWNLNNFYKFNISSQKSNIEDISLVHCRLISYMTFVALQLSSWCLTAVSLDRALSLFWFQWKQSYGRIKYTTYYILILTLVCLAVNSHILFFNGYRMPSGAIQCYSTRSNTGYIYPQWELVHLVLYNLCPFALMFICNTYIIYITVRSSRSHIDSVPMRIHRKSIERYRQFTVLLIIVTFAFVLLTSPACIYFVFFRHNLASDKQRNYRYMIQILVNSIQFTSHGINFFLYCFSAKGFRYALRGMFKDLFSKLPCSCRVSLEHIDSNDRVQRYMNHNQQVLLQQRRIHQQKFNYFPDLRQTREPKPNWV